MEETRRDKLPKGWCYPLKASALEKAISDAGIRTPVTLFLHHGSFWAKRPLFSAGFYLAGALVKNEDEEFWVGCRSVPADDCTLVRSYVEGTVIPEFADWAAKLEALPINATNRKTQHMTRDWPTP